MKKFNLKVDEEAKKKAILLLISVLLTVFASFLDDSILKTGIFLLAYLIAAQRVLRKAFTNAKNGNFFSENMLMSIATIGAILIGEYPEAVAVMVFYEVGDIIEDMAVGNSKRSISSLLEAKPTIAHLQNGDDWDTVDPSLVKVGDILLVKPGEKVPLDAVVISGTSSVNTAALTGESVPQTVKAGDQVLAGSVNQEGVITIQAEKLYEDSAVSKILDMVQNASESKAPTEKFITKFAKYYTPIVVISALFLAILPPLLAGGDWSEWIHRALVFLVISCPCALVLSVPLGFFAGIGSASKKGVLIKGSNYLEALNDLDTVVFDKTGTLTEGVFEVTEIKSYSHMKEQDILATVAAVEQSSNHPIAKSILAANTNNLDTYKVDDVEEIAGHGLAAVLNNQKLVIGNEKAMTSIGLTVPKENLVGTLVYLAIDGELIGVILVSDKIKSDAKAAIDNLKAQGVQNIAMLTGDNKEVADSVADQLGVSQVHANLLPEDKVKILEGLKNKSHANKKKIAFVGDGINDTPVLTMSDIGISMGGIGSDAAVEASDMVIMNDKPSAIPTTIGISKFTRKIVMQNIIFALIIKFLVIILGTLGYANMWHAVFADVGVTVLAVLNTLRIMRHKF